MADGSRSINTADEGYSVERLRRQYLDFAGDKKNELTEQRQARHYYHGDQYTAAELATLALRKQPAVYSPRLARKIDGLIGLLEKTRADPKAYPRTPQQEDGAELGTAAMRYALDECDWRSISPAAGRNGAINGIGGVELYQSQGDRGDADVGMQVVDAESYFYDPRSVRDDFSDARYQGIAKWVDLEVAQEMFPDKADELKGLIDHGTSASEQMQDRESQWVNSREKQVFLVEHWYQRGGEWRWCFYTNLTELKSGPSPFRDEKGKSFCRFIMYSANIDHDGDRYGFVRNLKSLVDEHNARRSKAIHLMHTRRIIAETGAVNDVEKTRREAVRPDGYLEVNPGLRFEFDDNSKQVEIANQIEMLQEIKGEIENFGPNPELMGQGSDAQSGRAIALKQQAGIAELGPFIIAYRSWKIRVYRAVWNMLQTTWTAERYIRVTDDENVAQFIKLNGVGIDPRTGQPTMVNALGSLDVDIILDEGPDTINMQADTYETLVALAQQGAQVPPEVLIEVSNLPSSQKKKLIGMLEKARQPDPVAEQAKQIMVAAEAAKVDETKSKTMKNMAQAHAAIQPEPQQAPAQQAPKGPSESINFKDIPPEAQAQMLAQAGIHIHPAILAAHAAMQAQQQTQQAAQLAQTKAAAAAQHRPAPAA